VGSLLLGHIGLITERSVQRAYIGIADTAMTRQCHNMFIDIFECLLEDFLARMASTGWFNHTIRPIPKGQEVGVTSGRSKVTHFSVANLKSFMDSDL
jgi:hypothetical protein